METTAKLFKSLADETRLRILLLLHQQGELCICDLMNALDQPQSTVSRHVAYLKRVGWLNDRRGGVWMYYSLRPDLSSSYLELLKLLTEQCTAMSDCIADRDRLVAYQHEKNCI